MVKWLPRARRAVQWSSADEALKRTLPDTGMRLSATEQRAQGTVMLLVLPFDNLSRDPEQDYFSEGSPEELIGRRSR